MSNMENKGTTSQPKVQPNSETAKTLSWKELTILCGSVGLVGGLMVMSSFSSEKAEMPSLPPHSPTGAKVDSSRGVGVMRPRNTILKVPEAKDMAALSSLVKANKSLSIDSASPQDVTALRNILRARGFLPAAGVTSTSLKAAIAAANCVYGFKQSDVASPAMLKILIGEQAAPVAPAHHPAVKLCFEQIMLGGKVLTPSSASVGTQDIQIIQQALIAGLHGQKAAGLKGALSVAEIDKIARSFKPGIFNSSMGKAVIKFKDIESACNPSFAETLNHDAEIGSRTFFALAKYERNLIPDSKIGALTRADFLICRDLLSGETAIGRIPPSVVKGHPAIPTIQSLLEVTDPSLNNYTVAVFDRDTENSFVKLLLESRLIRHMDWGNLSISHQSMLALFNKVAGKR